MMCLCGLPSGAGNPAAEVLATRGAQAAGEEQQRVQEAGADAEVEAAEAVQTEGTEDEDEEEKVEASGKRQRTK